MTIANTNRTKAYCNVMAMEKGLDPIGYARTFDTCFALELPLPWVHSIIKDQPNIPDELRQLGQLYAQLPPEERLRVRPMFIVPDEAYSQAGYRRLLHYTRPNGAFSAFTKSEYLVPESEVDPLLWALQQSPEKLPQFDAYRVNDSDVRDLMICTHGTVDVACAKFGFPVYQHLRQNVANEQLRVWRVSHFGGHIFAPTVLDMPTGHYWAYMDGELGQQVAERRGDATPLRGHYRGWSGMGNSFLQALDRELWQQQGWSWFDVEKEGQVLRQDDDEDPQWADVRITHQKPGTDQQVTVEAHVVVKRSIETRPSSRGDKINTYPQYHVETMEINA